MKSKYDTKEILRNGTDPLNIPNGTYPVGKTQDTPEQTESDVQGWEEEWQSTPVYNQISFIKNLLKEREGEAQIEILTEIFQTCYQEDSKTLELVEEKLSKLTTK